jgi:hypothetical protein
MSIFGWLRRRRRHVDPEPPAPTAREPSYETLYSPDPRDGSLRRFWRKMTQFPVRNTRPPVGPPLRVPHNHPTVRVPEPNAPELPITEQVTKKELP